MPEPGDGKSAETNAITLEIDGEEKSFSADDVKNLVAQRQVRPKRPTGCKYS